jgi:hypothetical protein
MKSTIATPREASFLPIIDPKLEALKGKETFIAMIQLELNKILLILSPASGSASIKKRKKLPN